jgi:hypothetical protein
MQQHRLMAPHTNSSRLSPSESPRSQRFHLSRCLGMQATELIRAAASLCAAAGWILPSGGRLLQVAGAGWSCPVTEKTRSVCGIRKNQTACLSGSMKTWAQTAQPFCMRCAGMFLVPGPGLRAAGRVFVTLQRRKHGVNLCWHAQPC